MSPSIGWLHIGDPHLEAADGWESRDRLRRIVAEANDHLGNLDFAFLPGDIANNGLAEEYGALHDALFPLRLPWRAIPGDHDMAPGGLGNFLGALAEANRPETEVIAGHRCIFLDIVSGGGGGPDFRLTMHHRNRLAQELAIAAAAGQPALVFMHAYPGDLAADGAEIARIIADAAVRFVSTGHTHYNELLNDGRTIYGAVRSTGQIEEAGGAPGYAVVCVHDGVPSWRFRPLGQPFPMLQIVSPCDLRLATRLFEPAQVPRPGPVDLVARSFGPLSGPVQASVDDRAAARLAPEPDGFWRGTIEIDRPGLFRVTVEGGGAWDEIELLVRPAEAPPKRRPPVALGESCHAIGCWPRAGLLGTRLGPNSNGRDW
ncbi:metallophosphoesterase family protein [Rhizosaccharibacter radicis]|uniref:Metallophosphoesterase n=1 Tax=Rhizosaccharibacter radicis TaxID=2782605 RepID=A0ABT1VUK5_9PROT|nr:metallophosphoesterase [Acetobacteraceae bacterium KSS12]